MKIFNLNAILALNLILFQMAGGAAYGAPPARQRLACSAAYLHCIGRDDSAFKDESYTELDSRICDDFWFFPLEREENPLGYSIRGDMYEAARLDHTNILNSLKQKLNSSNGGVNGGEIAANVAVGTLNMLDPYFDLMLVAIAPALPFEIISAAKKAHQRGLWSKRRIVGEILWEAELGLYDAPILVQFTNYLRAEIPAITPEKVSRFFKERSEIGGAMCSIAVDKHKNRKMQFLFPDVNSLADFVKSHWSKN